MSVGMAEQKWSLERVGGVAGLAFAGGVALQNGVLLAGNPMADAPLAEIQDYYSGASGRISIAVGLVALNILLLVFFGSAVTKKLAARDGSSIAARAGLGGIVLLGGAFFVTTLLQAVLAARVDQLAEAGQLQVVWDLHTAAFSMSGSGLGVTLAALSIGALLADAVVPRWTALVGLVGAVCAVAAGALVVSTISGGPGIWLQLVGFAAWLVWLVVGSLNLLRSEVRSEVARAA